MRLQKMNIRFIPLLILAVAMAFGSCQNSGDHSDKVETLDSLYTEVEAAEEVLKNIPHDTAVKTIEKIKKDLTFVQDTYEGDMRMDIAVTLSDYRATSRIIKHYGDRHGRLKSEVERTKMQLTNLKKALESGATEDKEGNKITAEYVDKAFRQEKKIAENLVKEIMEMRDRVEMMQERYIRIWPEVRPILDSLKRTTI